MLASDYVSGRTIAKNSFLVRADYICVFALLQPERHSYDVRGRSWQQDFVAVRIRMWMSIYSILEICRSPKLELRYLASLMSTKGLPDVTILRMTCPF